MHDYAKNSETLEKWVAENYDKIKEGKINEDSPIEFPMDLESLTNNEKRGLFNTVHRANIAKQKINKDGSITLNVKDPYNFEKWDLWPQAKNTREYAKNLIKVPYAIINNQASDQQQAKQLEQYLLSMPITYTKKEIEEIKRKYFKKI